MKDPDQSERMFVPLALVQLPPFPTVAVKVLKLASNTDSSLQQLGDTVAADPVFGSEILKIVNSPLYGLPNPICSIMGAVALLGTEYVKGLAVTIGVRAYLGCALGNPSVRAIWRHSLATGLLAEELGRVSHLEQGIAYTAGIMHDIGRVALAVLAPREYTDFLREAHGSRCDCRLLEQRFFSEDHCRIGRRMALAGPPAPVGTDCRASPRPAEWEPQLGSGHRRFGMPHCRRRRLPRCPGTGHQRLHGAAAGNDYRPARTHGGGRRGHDLSYRRQDQLHRVHMTVCPDAQSATSRTRVLSHHQQQASEHGNEAQHQELSSAYSAPVPHSQAPTQ